MIEIFLATLCVGGVRIVCIELEYFELGRYRFRRDCAYIDHVILAVLASVTLRSIRLLTSLLGTL